MNRAEANELKCVLALLGCAAVRAFRDNHLTARELSNLVFSQRTMILLSSLDADAMLLKGFELGCGIPDLVEVLPDNVDQRINDVEAILRNCVRLDKTDDIAPYPWHDRLDLHKKFPEETPLTGPVDFTKFESRDEQMKDFRGRAFDNGAVPE